MFAVSVSDKWPGPKLSQLMQNWCEGDFSTNQEIYSTTAVS